MLQGRLVFSPFPPQLHGRLLFSPFLKALEALPKVSVTQEAPAGVQRAPEVAGDALRSMISLVRSCLVLWRLYA